MQFSRVRWSLLLTFMVVWPLGRAYSQPGNSWPVVSTQRIAAFDHPVHATGAGDGSGRLFVVELTGKIWIVQGSAVLPTPFMDLISKLDCGDGRLRLLSIAFPPGFGQTKQHFYVKHLDKSCNIVIARYRTTADPNVGDLSSEQIVLSLPVGDGLFGGPLYFGPDGYLYAAIGDGSLSDTQPGDNAQDATKLLGKMLRLDVETNPNGPYTIPPSNPFAGPDGVRDEIWAKGFRNPWRFTFDRVTGDMYIGDVGSLAYEEIDFQPASSPGGENYGWKIKEADHCFGAPTCDSTGLTPPIIEYSHSVGCSVTGGAVYRGSTIPSLQGIYVYGDLCSGKIYGLRRVEGVWETALLGTTEYGAGPDHSPGLSIVSFGEDDNGNIYVLDYGHQRDGGFEDPGGLYLLTLGASSGPVVTFSATPGGITVGESSTLSWSTTNAVTVSINQAIGNVNLNGSLPVSPTTTTTYTLTATDGNGVVTIKTATVIVNQPLAPAAPTSLIATANSASEILLTWVDASSNEQGFMIERCEGTSCVNFVQSNQVGPNVTSSADSTLVGGTQYRYRVRAFGTAGNSEYSNIASGLTPPNAPSGLSAVLASPTQVNLSWSVGSGLTGVRVERCASAACVNFAQIVQLTGAVTSYANSGLGTGTLYRYRVRAFNNSGNSAYSATVDITTAPPAPTGFTATPLATPQIQLRWNDTSSETEFRLERCTGVGCTNFAPIAGSPVAADVLTLIDASGESGTLYRYRVRAVNGGAESAPSSIAETTTLPTAPNLSAVLASATQVNLSWPAVSGASGVRIERCAGAGCVNFVQIVQVTGATTSYTNTGLAAGTVYRYRARAYNNGGNSSYSTTIDLTTPPPAPTGFTATLLASQQVQLRWNDTTGETEFRLERCEGVGCINFAPIAGSPVAANVLTLIDTTVQSGVLYRYRVRAANAAGAESAPSSIAQATTLPTAPTLAAVLASSTQVNLSWALVPGATGVKIERCMGSTCVTFSQIAQVTGSTTTYANSGLSAGTAYSYRARSYNISGNSSYSNVVEVILPPTAPGALIATANSATQITLRWNDPSARETGFRIERCAGAACLNFAEVGQVAANVIVFVDSGLTSATIYRYRVRGFNAGGDSLPSNIAQAATP